MMIKTIEDCLDLNMKIKSNNLINLTWGNASVLNDLGDKIAIKPSGVEFKKITYSKISVVDVYDGNHLSGGKPSVDTPIHLEIYRSFPEIKSVIHIHGKFSTAWAQAQMPIPICGTTHADYFFDSIPIARNLLEEELDDYEKNLGISVVDYFQKNKINPLNIPAILLPGHGALIFTDSTQKTLECAIVLEEIAEIAYYTKVLNPTLQMSKLDRKLFTKHFDRKNGIQKYYGQ